MLSEYVEHYVSLTKEHLDNLNCIEIEFLANDLLDCWRTGRQLFVCGNGGSGSNANHIANDLLYGISKEKGCGIKCHSLSSNPATLLCLANDEGYENIFSYQLDVLAKEGDLLLVLSGSGNSPNILNVLREAKTKNVKSYAILGFDGGQAKELADVPIHFSVEDMQVSEDLQMNVLHMISQWLYTQR